MDTPQPKRRWHPESVAAYGCAVVVALVLAVTVPRAVLVVRLMRPRAVTLAEVQTLTGLRFPASTQLVYSHYERLPRASLDAKLYLPAAEVPGFLASAPFGAGGWERDSVGEIALRNMGLWESLPGKVEVLSQAFPAPRVTLEPRAQRLIMVSAVLAHPPSGHAVLYLLGEGD